MSNSLLLFLVVAYGVGLFGSVMLIIAAFRVHVGWGLGVLCIPFASFIFRMKHPDEVGRWFKISRMCYVLCGVIIAASPETFGPYKERLKAWNPLASHHSTPALASLRTTEPDADSDEEPVSSKATSPSATASSLAQQDIVTQQAAYSLHVSELNATYAQLQTERAALKGAGPAMTAFNAKAAEYQAGLRKLAEEKTRLDAAQQAVAATTSGNGSYTKAVAYSVSGAAADKPARR